MAINHNHPDFLLLIYAIFCQRKWTVAFLNTYSLPNNRNGLKRILKSFGQIQIYISFYVNNSALANRNRYCTRACLSFKSFMMKSADEQLEEEMVLPLQSLSGQRGTRSTVQHARLLTNWTTRNKSQICAKPHTLFYPARFTLCCNSKGMCVVWTSRLFPVPEVLKTPSTIWLTKSQSDLMFADKTHLAVVWKHWDS